MAELVAMDYQKLTLREQKALCDAAEVPNMITFGQRIESAEPTALAALVYIMKRQSDPSFTLDQAWDMNMDELRAMFPNAQSAEAALSSRPS